MHHGPPDPKAFLASRIKNYLEELCLAQVPNLWASWANNSDLNRKEKNPDFQTY